MKSSKPYKIQTQRTKFVNEIYCDGYSCLELDSFKKADLINKIYDLVSISRQLLIK